ncbi:hypothetical protein LY78DRAFT_663123 [Colletotrichum sublineola]|nr:hypothetical protein LY78DRAFT_663123 [Colletotrichum sublineola]
MSILAFCFVPETKGIMSKSSPELPPAAYLRVTSWLTPSSAPHVSRSRIWISFTCEGCTTSYRPHYARMSDKDVLAGTSPLATRAPSSEKEIGLEHVDTVEEKSVARESEWRI